MANSPALKWFHHKNGSEHILSSNEVTDDIDSKWFKPFFWQNNKSVVGESHGRNITYFIDHTQQDSSTLQMVLRRYYRGGMIGKLIKETFFYRGLEHTRAVAEFLLLLKMTELGLPVPKPIAVRVKKLFGFWCRNQILIERINGAQDMFHTLTEHAVDQEKWQQIGNTIKQFHNQGVFHSDLNIHNILQNPAGDIFLIDFDKCDIRVQNQQWQQQNLDRLKRSLLKEKRLNPEFHFTEPDWQDLMTGYQEN